MTFTVTVSSPEQLRDEFVAWLERQNEMTRTSIFVRERDRKILRAAWQEAAIFWRNIVIINFDDNNTASGQKE